jgi:cytochrome c biogenesis protein CcdA
MTVAWQLPPGSKVGPLRYPVPTRLMVADLMNHVFKGPYAVLTRLKVPADARGTLPIRATLDYLVCTDELCVPERGAVALDLPVGSGSQPTALRRAGAPSCRSRLAPGAPSRLPVDRLHVAIPCPKRRGQRAALFTPSPATTVRYADAQRFRRTADRLVAELPAGTGSAGGFEGVIDLGTGRALRFTATPGPCPRRRDARRRRDLALLVFAFLGAVAGGLMLNLMPCVFPILALKALALARAGGGEREAGADALGYTLGAVVGTGALGAILLLIRAGGNAAGWAFQLQDPRTTLLLFLLAIAITLNLIGLFKLPVLGGDSNPRGGFATGALAAFVATPCAGPFMGAALGTALLLPAAGALLVFAGLGFGLALPFLLLAFVPSLRQRLPKPGPWMARLQPILAVPMAPVGARRLVAVVAAGRDQRAVARPAVGRAPGGGAAVGRTAANQG